MKDQQEQKRLIEKEEEIPVIPEYKMEDLTEDALQGEKLVTKVERVAIFILNELGANNEKHAKIDDIYGAYIKHRETNVELVQITRNTFCAYLNAVSHKNKFIRCPGRKQGYYLSVTKQQDPKIKESTEGSEITKDEKLWEKHLYPIIVSYVSTDENLEWCLNVASSRKNHEWGNTDIMTLRTLTLLGVESFEICAYEVKLSMKSWRKDIFEAVSHSMFSNRTYFTFVRVIDQESVPNEMIKYAQRFHIGLIALEIEESDWATIVQNPNKIKPEMFDFVEVVPAPYQNCDPEIQNNFFLRLGIQNFKELREYDKVWMDKQTKEEQKK